MKNFSKKLLLILVALMPCFQASVMAEPDVIPIKPKPNPDDPNPNPGGPRARSRSRNIEVSPSCFYEDGEVSIYVDSNIVSISATVIRLDDNMQWSGAGLSNTLTFAVSDDPGTYLLMFTLSDGKSYYGEYTLY